MRELRRIFTYNCDEDEDSKDERGEKDDDKVQLLLVSHGFFLIVGTAHVQEFAKHNAIN
jgi:hypothetical protein